MHVNPFEPYWTRITFLGKVDIDMDRINAMIANSPHYTELLSIRQIELFTPLTKIAPRMPIPSSSPSTWQWDMLDDYAIFQMFEYLPIFDLVNVAGISSRFKKIATRVFSERYRNKRCYLEDLTTYGVLTYPEVEKLVRTFPRNVPLTHDTPEEYETFITCVLIDIGKKNGYY